MSPNTSCIMCKIVSKAIPCHKLAETKNALAFMDIAPLSKGHCLVIPKSHGEFLHDVPDEILAEILPLVKKIAKAIGCTNYNVLQNNGRLAHQAVDHVHFHLIPKPNSETGLKINWDTLSDAESDLAAYASEIMKKL